MSEVEPTYLFFPIVNEQGFVVDSAENYNHMIRTIITAQVELREDYPDDVIIVYYACGEAK